MSAVNVVAAFTLSMQEHGLSREITDKIVDTALRLIISREEKAIQAMRDTAPMLYPADHGLTS